MSGDDYMKKIVSIIVALVITSTMFPAFAAEDTEQPQSTDQDEIQWIEDITVDIDNESDDLPYVDENLQNENTINESNELSIDTALETSEIPQHTELGVADEILDIQVDEGEPEYKTEDYNGNTYYFDGLGNLYVNGVGKENRLYEDYYISNLVIRDDTLYAVILDETALLLNINSGEVVTQSSVDGEVELFANSNETQVYNFLTGTMKLNIASACGVLSNIRSESGFDPTEYGDGGTSYGICQWHDSRFTDLKNYCKKNGYNYTSLTGQLNFLYYELKNSYKGTLNYLKKVSNSANGAYDAGYYWCYHFERPANKGSVSVTRGNYAKNTYWPKYGKTKPSTPKLSSISATSTSALTLKWKAATNATSYDIYRKKGNGSYSKIGNTTGTSYKDTGLSAGTKYSYYIYAKNSIGKTKSSALSSYTKPNKPTISKVERVSTSKLKITWGKVSSVDSYIIKRRRGDKDDYEQIKTTTATSFTDTGLKGGARYWYRVYAVKGNVKSDRSETEGNFTQMKAPSISVSTANTISMSWEKAIGTNQYAYEVYYKKATDPDSSYKKIATTSYTGGTSQQLEPGTMYNYKIKVIVENTGGYCTWSNVATGMTLFDKPEVTTLGDTSLKIEWDKLQGKGSYQYGLYRKVATDTTNKTSTRVATLTDTSYIDTGLTPGVSYYYKFVVEDKNNNLTRVSYSAIGAGTTTDSSGFTFVLPDAVLAVLKGTVYDETDGEIKDAIESVDEDLGEGIIDESDETPNEIADCETNTNEEGVTEYTASFPDVTTNNVKFFVWDSISSLRPLANSVSATYNDMQDDPEVSTDTDNLEGEL